MKAEDFIKAYEAALAAQNWNNVEPLMSDKVCVTFSDGVVHEGLNKVQEAFENNFSVIKNEEYAMKNIRWLMKSESYAVYLFEYYWSGMINDKSVSGSGVGTSVIIKQEGKWHLLTEHLGKQPIV